MNTNSSIDLIGNVYDYIYIIFNSLCTVLCKFKNDDPFVNKYWGPDSIYQLFCISNPMITSNNNNNNNKLKNIVLSSNENSANNNNNNLNMNLNNDFLLFKKLNQISSVEILDQVFQTVAILLETYINDYTVSDNEIYNNNNNSCYSNCYKYRYVCICIYVCIYVYEMYVCMYVCMYTIIIYYILCNLFIFGVFQN